MKNELRGFMVVRKADRDTETHQSGECFLDYKSFSETLQGTLNNALAEDGIIQTDEYKPPSIVSVIPVFVTITYYQNYLS